MIHSYVTWLTHVWRKSCFRRAVFRIDSDSESQMTFRITAQQPVSQSADGASSRGVDVNMWRASITYGVTNTCVTGLSRVWHVTHICDTTLSCVTWHTHMWHYSIGTAEGLMMSIRHVPPSRVMWLIYVTRLCNMWQDARMCDTTLLAQHQVSQVSDGAAWKGDGEVALSSVKNVNAKQVYVCAWERERGREKERECVCVLYMRVNVNVHIIYYNFFCIHVCIYI